ncbi:hypothetical protein BU16DRAFT_370423 [Lophium mytilinum]|uniref:Uncharacterized protein n=1 Tax=Lophium mytilinum TaxID=390894 RepID=A0A6A6QVQ7_9PEZI|nr:hypothetical protein BU16DRAFT_370423 [Lophium mytilinum]
MGGRTVVERLDYLVPTQYCCQTFTLGVFAASCLVDGEHFPAVPTHGGRVHSRCPRRPITRRGDWQTRHHIAARPPCALRRRHAAASFTHNSAPLTEPYITALCRSAAEEVGPAFHLDSTAFSCSLHTHPGIVGVFFWQWKASNSHSVVCSGAV